MKTNCTNISVPELLSKDIWLSTSIYRKIAIHYTEYIEEHY
jgi:hypothetical protein